MDAHDIPFTSLSAKTRQSYARRAREGFVEKYLSGANVLDVGFRGGNPEAVPVTERSQSGSNSTTLITTALTCRFPITARMQYWHVTYWSTYQTTRRCWQSGTECCVSAGTW